MKIAYFTIWREDSETVGINMKIKNQVKAFAELGCESYFCVSACRSVRLYRYQNGALHLIAEKDFTPKSVYDSSVSSIKRRLGSTHRLNECLAFFDTYVQSENYDVIYIRRILPITGKLASYIKKWHNSGHKVVWEIPTWNSLAKTLYWRILHVQEQLMYTLLNRNIDRIVAIYSAEEIKNNILFINNGVDLDTVPIKKVNDSKTINLICLATFSYWHGYDRLLNGLKDYYASGNAERDIDVYMVGNGNVDDLKQIVKDGSLEEHVHFTGVCVGNELDRLFDSMDIAVGNLGFFREGVFSDTSIKIREYCARGIPFITALTVNDFPKNYKYIHTVPMNEDYIDIDGIIDFYDGLDMNRARSEMREYAEANLSWKKQLAKVLSSVGYPPENGSEKAE